MENTDGYDHSILAESHIMMIQFGVGLLLFMTYYAVFLVIDRNGPVCIIYIILIIITSIISFILLHISFIILSSHAYN